MTKEEVLEVVGEFTWNFGTDFFVETPVGRFVWSSPEYGGTDTLCRYRCTYDEWIAPDFGRAKGMHTLYAFCGDTFTFEN